MAARAAYVSLVQVLDPTFCCHASALPTALETAAAAALSPRRRPLNGPSLRPRGRPAPRSQSLKGLEIVRYDQVSYCAASPRCTLQNKHMSRSSHHEETHMHALRFSEQLFLAGSLARLISSLKQTLCQRGHFEAHHGLVLYTCIQAGFAVASRSVDAILAANRSLTRNGDGLSPFVATSNSGSSSSGNISSVSSGNSSSGNDEGGEKASRDRDESEVIFTHALLLGDYTCLFFDPFLPLSSFLFLSSFSSSFSSLETPVSYPLFVRLWSLCVSCYLGVGPCLRSTGLARLLRAAASALPPLSRLRPKPRSKPRPKPRPRRGSPQGWR